MKYESLKDIPSESFCSTCKVTKPIAEMLVIRMKKENHYIVRPNCKSCHNANERGKRREYKTQYLRKWRAKNKKLNRSYWDNAVVKEYAAIAYKKRKETPEFQQRRAAQSAERFARDSLIKAIQRRFFNEFIEISFEEAAEYLDQFGCYYPSRQGLTNMGLKECERIRSTMRRRGMKRYDAFNIRLAVYEDGTENGKFLISPENQLKIYKNED
jgi:hypothetical protein